MDWQIRLLTADDASPYLALRLSALQESPTAFGSSFEEERGRTLAQVALLLSGGPAHVALGAFDGEALVAQVRVGREDALKERHRGFIRGLYVAVPARGQGLGTKLLGHALQVASSWPGLEQLTLAVNAGNQPAIAMYGRAGFTEYGRAPRALCVAGQYHDELLMVRHGPAA